MESQSEHKDEESEKNIGYNKCILSLICSKCGKKLSSFITNQLSNKKNNCFSSDKNKNIINDNECPYCNFNLSRCSVCSCPIKLDILSNKECLAYCNKCLHGGHYNHYKDWFKEFTECPNSKCSCQCQLEDKETF